MKSIAIAALISTLATGAFAHSAVDKTTPENEAMLTEVPHEITFDFADDIRLTRVEMVRQDHPLVTLDLGEQKGFDRAFILPMQGMGDGTYQIEWRGLG